MNHEDTNTPSGHAAGPGAQSVMELLRSLVIAVRSAHASSQHHPADAHDCEEILLDTDADGYRYMLLRSPLFNETRVLLSPREHEIARMVATGYPTKAIASVLNISCWTVGTHLRRIYAKLGVKSRAGMVGRLHELRIDMHADMQARASSAPERRRA